LLCAAFGSSALTLGRVRGAALIGRPLDVVIQVQLEGPDEQASSLCFDADVFHADTKQDPSRVKVSMEANEAAGTAQVRVQSQSVVDEPIVTIYLRAGCTSQKVTRRYVLLADLPSEVAAPAIPLVVPAPVAAPAPAPVDKLAGPSDAGRASQGEAAGSPQPTAVLKAAPAAPAPAPKPRKQPAPRVARAEPAPVKAAQTQAAAPAAKPAASAPAPAVEKAKPAAAPGQPRLRLDPMESLAERVATLEAIAPAAPASADEAARVKSLESDVKALLTLATKNEASLAELRMRLEKAESERFSVVWIYLLAGLVLACLAAIALLWSRNKRPLGTDPSERSDWWRGAQAAAPAPVQQSRPAPDTADLNSKAPEPQAPKPGLAPSLMESGNLDEVDVNLVDMDDSMFDKMMKAAGTYKKPEPQKPEPAVAGGAPRRVVDSDELMDVRQQAEFFVSLGQTDQAIQVLEKRIAKGDCGPLMYLDLLSIFHSRSLKTDFRQMRDEFNRLFNGRIPEFAAFKEEGRGIDSYPSVFAHIVALWPSAKVLEIIETCIFRDPWDDRDQAFDLYAFRDLLLLYAIAKGISEGQYGEPPVSAPAPLRPSEILELTPSHFDSVNPQATVALVTTPPPQPVPAATLPLTGAPLDLTLEPLEGEQAPLPKLEGVGAVDVDLSETELGTIYAPSFTSPVPLTAGGAPKPLAPPLEMPTVDMTPDDDIPSLMDFELPVDPPAPTPPKPKTGA
jgi:hypothetical protein